MEKIATRKIVKIGDAKYFGIPSIFLTSWGDKRIRVHYKLDYDGLLYEPITEDVPERDFSKDLSIQEIENTKYICVPSRFFSRLQNEEEVEVWKTKNKLLAR